MIHLLKRVAISDKAFGSYLSLNEKEDQMLLQLKSYGLVEILETETRTHYTAFLTDEGKKYVSSLM